MDVTVESTSMQAERRLIKHAGDTEFSAERQRVSPKQRESFRGERDYRVSHGNETVRRGSRKSLARDLSSFIRPPARSCQRSDAHGKLCQNCGPSTYLPTYPYIRAYYPAVCIGIYGHSRRSGDGGNICAVLTGRQWDSTRHAIYNHPLPILPNVSSSISVSLSPSLSCLFSIIHEPPFNLCCPSRYVASTLRRI